MSLFHCLTYQSINPGLSKCSCFITQPVFMVRSCQHLAQPPSWRTTPCQLSVVDYSIFSQLPSILEAVPPFTTWGRAIPWWCGPTFHGSFGLTSFKFPATSFHLTSLHFTSLHCTFRQFLPHFYSFHFTPLIIAVLTLTLKILGFRYRIFIM